MKYWPDTANLSLEDLEKLQTMEKELGVVLVAFEKMPQFASLAPDALEEMNRLEKKLGIRLIALK